MTARELSMRAAKLMELVPSIAPSLQVAIERADADPQESLGRSRKVLETIVKEMAACDLIDFKGSDTGKILRDKKFRQLVPAEIRGEMQFVYPVASEYGSHVGMPPPGMAFKTVERLFEIVDWYATEYMGSGLVDNFDKPIDRDDKLVLYVSSGGTDRCAMANVITRHYLTLHAAASHIRPISVALNKPTGATMTPLAAEILREKLGIEVPEHKTIRGNERYWRRAQLVLPMTAKLLRQLPSATKEKSHLFSEFYGERGNIKDPFEEGPELYLQAFNVINGIIEPHIEALIGWAK